MTDSKPSDAVASLRIKGKKNRPFVVRSTNGSGARVSADIDSKIEARLRGLLEAVPEAMLLVSQRGKIILLNHLAEEWFGYPHDELLGALIKTIVPDGFPKSRRYKAAADSAEPHQGALFELSGLRKDGTRFPLELVLSSLESAEGLMTTVVIRDISVRKDAEKHLEDIEEKYLGLKNEEQLKDEFVATVSHELRTPLTSISGSLGLLMGKTSEKLPESATRLIEIAHRSSQRLVRLVSDILDLQKMEHGLIVYIFKRIEMKPLLEAVIEANRGYAESYGVQVILEDTTAVGDVRADADRLTQAITNLLSNAIKFSPRDGEVTVSVQERGDMIRLSVCDHGPGISADFAPRIFEKFSQADASHSRPKDGTGLGMSIVKQIVDRLDGNVGFDGTPGGGTTFYIDLPTWEQGARMMRDPDTASDTPRVLLCEDDPDTATAIRIHLKQLGFATDFAYNVADAIASASATQYCAVLTDLLLPDNDGVSLIQSLRELPNYSATPIVVVSANALHGREDPRASDLHVLDWLSKPVDFDHLKRVLPNPAARHPPEAAS